MIRLLSFNPGFQSASLAVAALLAAGCGPGGSAHPSVTLQNKGSDTMVNLAQAWSEEYKKAVPSVDVEVSGGGSGVGIAALIKGAVDIANSSRDLKREEAELAEKNTGKPTKEFVAGFDALAVYVHKDNPLEEISLEQIAQIFAEGGTITLWSQLGVTMPRGRDRIIRVSRQSSSGTYAFFRERALSKKDFKLGSHDMNGSKEVVELTASTPGAIGYSGMGYHEPGKVKMLRVSARAGEPAYPPTVGNVLSKRYPLARALHLYTLGEPTGETRKYLDWIFSDAGQQVVQRVGYVPIPEEQRKNN
jgi:phosphate transport system substrate-binding protein